MSYEEKVASLLRLLASGKPEVEPTIKEIPITNSTVFGKPSFERRAFDGTQKIWRFKNSYGASVVRHLGSYGSDSGLWELAVLRFKGEEWSLCYDTAITHDVVGSLMEEEVEKLLSKIKQLRGETKT